MTPPGLLFAVTDLSALDLLACALAAALAGLVNAIAGGGTLISFPIMTAVGVPALLANATSTVSLCPGYVGGTFAQRQDLASLGERLRPRLLTAAVCGLLGSVLLVGSGEALFRSVVPFLVIGASVLLAVQVPLRTRLFRQGHRRDRPALELVAVGVASVYGGYFGAGLGIVLMAVLGLFSDQPLSKINAVKQLLSISVSISAAAFFVYSERVDWRLFAIMAPASLLGGHLGGRLVGSIPTPWLRAGVVAYGLAAGFVFLLP